MSQTQSEIQLIVGKWETSHKPSNLLTTDHNINLVVAWILANKDGLYTVQGLNEAVKALGNRLEYATVQYVDRIVEKIVEKQVVKEVVRKKSDAQIRREGREALQRMGIGDRNFRPTTEFDRAPSKAAVKESAINQQAFEATQQHVAELELDRLIGSWTANSPSGRVDHGNTHKQREAMRAIHHDLANGATDYVSMLRDAHKMVAGFERDRTRNNSW
jgi:hypothetical protein